MANILIADDHQVVREGLRQILSDEPDIGVVGEAQDSQEVLELAAKQDWDIVVLDISMPGRGGLDVLKELKKHHPKLPVLILSMHSEDQYAVRALKAGAAGYVTKKTAHHELVQAIKKILQGGKYISASLADRLASHLETQTERPLHESLSDREYQVMIMIASGKKTGEIAEELSLSIKTVDNYRARALEKMGLRNNVDLVHYVLRNNLLD